MRICFLGDSITNGVNDPEFLGWPGRLCQRFVSSVADLTVYNLGVRADTTAQILQRGIPEVKYRLPEGADGRVVLSCGVADAVLIGGVPRIPSFDSLANLRQMIDQLSPHYPLLIIGPTPVINAAHAVGVAEINSAYRSALAETDIPFCDVYDQLSQSSAWKKDLQTADGIHPQAAGYTALADIVAAWEPWQAWFKK